MPKRSSLFTILTLILLLALSTPRVVASASVNAANLLVSHSPQSFLSTDPRHPCPHVRQVPSLLLTLLHANPSRTIAARALARLYCLQGDVESSHEMWQQALARSPNDAVSAYHLALTSFALNEPVHTRYDRDISNEAVRRGRALQAQKATEAAQSWYEFALWLTPNPSAAAYLAGIYRARKQPENALAVWDDVIARLSPDSADYWWAVAQWADMQSAWEDAARAYLEAARRAPPERAYVYDLTAGDRWARVKAYEQAEAAYRQALDLDPKRVDAYIRLGNLARAQKAYERALTWYRRAQQVAPESYLPLYYMGVMERDREGYGSALRYFDAALEKAPKAAWVWYYKALTLDALDRREEALAALSQAVALHSNPPKGWTDLLAHWQTYPDRKRDPQYWWVRGRQQERKRLWHSALGFYHYGAQLAKPPDDYQLLLREALMWRYLKQPEQAGSIYHDLVSRYPDRMDAYIGLGDLARERSAWNEAMRWYKKAWQVAPDHYVPPYYLGLTAYYAKRYQEALEYLNRSLVLNPRTPWTWYFKALSLKALERDQDAVAALEKAIALYKSPPADWVKVLKQWQGE